MGSVTSTTPSVFDAVTLATSAGVVTVAALTASVDEVASLIATTLYATYPGDVVDVLVERSTDRTRLSRNLADRQWFEARLEASVLVGVAAVHLTSPTSAYLSSHHVVLRRHGIGRVLTACRVSWARSRGATHLTATTHPWNAASLSNLHTFGFEVTGESADAWAPPGTLLELSADL